MIDDSDAMRTIIERTLRRCLESALVLEAKGVSAAEAVLADEAVDIVLSDWRLLDGSGFDLLATLRSRGWSGIFGFVTAESGSAAVSQALGAGATFVVAKPFRAEELERAIAAARGETLADEVVPMSDPIDQINRISSSLQGLLGRPVAVTRGVDPPRSNVARMVARYVDIERELSAVIIAELSFVTNAAAAFGLFPPALAKEWADCGGLPDELVSNYFEIANVLSQVVRDDQRRCVVDELTLYAPSERITGKDVVEPPGRELSLEVDITDYGAGRIAVIEASSAHRGLMSKPRPEHDAT